MINVVKARSRYLILLECECCGGTIKRSIQDINAQKLGKGQTKCPHCGATITYDKGLLPTDISG